MKNKITVLLIAIVLIACSKEKNQLSIHGKVSNYSKNYLLFIQDTVGYGLSTYADTINIDEKGNFDIQTELLNSDALIVFEDSKPFRLTISKHLNKPIKVELDLSKPDSIKVEGEQAPFIQFDFDQQKYWLEIYKEMSSKHPELAAGNNQSLIYHAVQDTITGLRMQFLDSYFKNLDIENEKDFINDERNSLLYSNFLTYSDKIDFSDKRLLSIQYFREFINEFIMDAVRVENPQGDYSSYVFYLHNGFKVIDKWFKKPQINILQKIVFINHLIETAKAFNANIKVYEFQIAIENLNKNDFAINYCQAVEDKLQQLNNSMSKLSPGAGAPEFELQDINGKFHKSSDFGNKILVIDVWASWCGNCISSFPEWNNLIEKYSTNGNFQFISVSIDEDSNKRLKAVGKYKPYGQKLFVGSNGFNSQFAKSFEIIGIPKYIIIDKENRIITISASMYEVQEILKKI
ncbi:Thiol-disulfide oxidoreductase ResA [subsurface metagenome]